LAGQRRNRGTEAAPTLEYTTSTTRAALVVVGFSVSRVIF